MTQKSANFPPMIYQAKEKIADLLTQHTSLSRQEILLALEIPKQFEFGHLAFPVFALAKIQKAAPPVIAQKLAQELSGKADFLANIQAVGGFLNFTFTDAYLQGVLLSSLELGSEVGFSKVGHGQILALDYGSPNVAKPMHVGHLRATMIGQAIRNLAHSQGYKVLGINHLGDWGSQFGKLAWAYMEWGHEYDFTKEPVDALVKLYVRFHDESEKNPELEVKGAQTFKKLEEGDADIRKVWELIIKYSLKEYDHLFGLLGVKHEYVLGESFYNDKMEAVVQRLKDKHLLQDSQGAQVVFFDEKENMPPCIIKKSDGASIYATRDLAAAIYRHEVLKAEVLLYVVGQDQTLHFRQVFKVLEMMGYEWAKNCHHISFGMYRFKDGKMSTRKGKVILFEDVVSQAIELVKNTIREKNPDLENQDLVAEQVAMGAVVFNDLINDRVKNVDFDWDRVLSTEGDSGPYVQYTAVRCKSILRKYGKPVVNTAAAWTSPEERKLVYSLLQFQDALSGSFRQYRPNILAQYLLELCSSFSHFYHKNRIIGEDAAIEASRIALVAATEKVLVQGLGILGIASPDAM